MHTGFKKLHQSIRKKKTWYVVAIIVSLIAILAFVGSAALATMFLPKQSFLSTYVMVSILSAILGGLTIHFIKNITEDKKAIVIAGTIVSGLAAILIGVYLRIINMIASISLDAGFAPLFKNVPNGLITGLLIIVFYNLFFVITIFKKNKGEIKDLWIYLIGLAGFLLLYFILPGMLISV
jgi:hypothetical protein